MRLCIVLVLALSGCASLPEIRNFSADTVALADSVDRIAQDTGASCLRRLSLDIPVKGLTEENRQAYADVCSQLKQASALFIDINGITRAYGMALGALADNRLVTYEAEISGAKDAIARLNDQAGAAYFSPAQLNSVASLADVVLHATTDAYRQKEIKRVLNHHEDLVALAGMLETYIRRAYLPVLENERGNLDSLAEILNERHLRTEPLRARELLEFIKQQRVNLSERNKAANDVLSAISKMIEVHALMLEGSDKLDRQEFAGLMSEYGRRIRNVRQQIHSAFR